MPKVVGFHFYHEATPYSYSEGYFVTLVDKMPPYKSQKQYMSSGEHKGHCPPDRIDKVRDLVQEGLLELKDEYDIVVVNLHDAAEDDHYFRFSGPNDGQQAVYVLDDQGKLKLKKGVDILKVKI
jgi:hypothetical protein